MPPAVHRFPGSMAARIQTLAAIVVDEYDGHAERLWTEADSGRELFAGSGAARLRQAEGADLHRSARQAARRPPDGWEAAAGDYAEEGSHRSVADVVDQESLDRVRAFKKQKKAAARGRSLEAFATSGTPGAGLECPRARVTMETRLLT